MLFMSVGMVAADVPILIPLQGKLLNSTGSVLSGAHTLNFSLFTAASGTAPVWTENRVGTNRFNVINGFFDVNLGDNATLANVNFTIPLWLEINVSGEILTPRMRLASAPYARTAERVFGVQTVNESLVSLTKMAASAKGAGSVLTVSNNGTDDAVVINQYGSSDALQIETWADNSENALDINHDSLGNAAIDIDLMDNSDGILVTKSANGGGALINVSSNSGTGPDISARNIFNVTNGATQGVTFASRRTSWGFSGNGSTLADLDASALANGTVASARISGAYAGVTGVGVLASGTVPTTLLSGTLAVNNLSSSSVYVFNGSSLTDLDASRILNGTLNPARINQGNNFNFTSTSNTYTGINYSGSYAQPAFLGNGSVLADLDASKLANGTVAVGRLGSTLVYAFNGSSVTDLDASRLVNGTVASGRLSGTYSGALVFSGATNNYTGSSDTLTRSAAQSVGAVLTITQNTDSAAVNVSQTQNNVGLNVSKTSTGVGSALLVENAGTGAILNLQALGTGNATITSSTGSGHWIANYTTRILYANGTPDATHGADSVQVENTAVTANSLILLQVSGATPGVPVTLFVNSRTANQYFNVTAVNASARTGSFWISYIMIN